MRFENRKYDVLGVGSSIVDVLSFVDEGFLTAQGLNKGIMTLIDAEMADKLYAAAPQSIEVSGGSVANTAAGVASMGGTAAFLGRINNDQLGEIFTHDMNGVGVNFRPKVTKSNQPTARSFIFVTPDAERTMTTYLGACTELNSDDIDEDLIANSKIVYIEGYLWNIDSAIAAIRKIIELAKKHGTKVCFTLSDPFCVSLHRQEFLDLLPSIDILLCNEDEAKSLFETDKLDSAVEQLSGKCAVTSITCGANGSIVIEGGNVVKVATAKVEKLVDTTGAGDLYAAGFLYGLANEKGLAKAAELGNKAAAQIIQQLGARSQKPLKDLAA